jgi:hypothetical protein
MPEIIFYRSRPKALKMILGSLAFVLLGVWELQSGAVPAWIAWTSILFFGIGLPLGLFHFFDRRPQIIINEIGVFDRTTHADFINWELIQHAYPIKISGQPFICLVVDEQFKPSKKKSFLQRQIAKMNEAVGAQELNIQLAQVGKVDMTQLTEFILLMRTATRAERKEQLLKALQQKSTR